MNRAEAVMLTYFGRDKAAYIAFKLSNNVVIEKNIGGYQNTELTVRDSAGDLVCVDGKPSIITIGRTHGGVSGTPIYCISWMYVVTNGGMKSGRYHRNSADGPAVIRCYRDDGQFRILSFSYMEADKYITPKSDQLRNDLDNHFDTAHKKATGISKEKFYIDVRS
jgi:hypothetical protein